MTVWDEGRALVGEGEGEAALDLVESFLKGRVEGTQASRVRSLLQTVIMVQAQGRRLADRARRGTLSPSDAEVERARRDEAILGLIDEIARMDQSRPPTVSVELSDRTVNEKLMGTESNLRSTGWLGEGLRLAGAVCRLVGGKTLGTGFRCRQDLILTNHHVIGTFEAAKSFRAEFAFEENAAGALQAPRTVALDPQRCFWTSEKLDVTLVGLAPISPDDIAVVPLAAETVAKVGDHVSIIQHPNGGPKQIAVTNNRILNIYDHRVQYLTDTLPGSSGSPVFLNSWQVLAIHHAGGNVRRNARGDVIFANEGILISAIFSDTGFLAAYEGGT